MVRSRVTVMVAAAVLCGSVAYAGAGDAKSVWENARSSFSAASLQQKGEMIKDLSAKAEPQRQEAAARMQKAGVQAKQAGGDLKKKGHGKTGAGLEKAGAKLETGAAKLEKK